MEKHIMRWSYWLGLVSLVVAAVWKGLNALGLWLPGEVTRGRLISYITFYNAGLLLFLACIASASCAWFKAQRPEV